MSEENKVDSNSENNSENKESISTIGQVPKQDAIDELQQQVEKWKNEYLYLRAEFDTYKRNAIKERAEISKYGSERLLNEILNVVDNFDRALNTKPTAENIDTYSQGVKMTAGELKSVLAKFGVTEVPCEGLAFDPSFHEALGAEESSTIAEGHILRVFRTAYKLHEKLIRPAQVIVAKSKTT